MAKQPEKPVSDTVRRLMEDEQAVKEAAEAARAKARRASEEAAAKKRARVSASQTAITVARDALSRWHDDLTAGKYQCEIDIDNALPVHGTGWTRIGLLSFFRPANRVHVNIAFGTTEDIDGVNGTLGLLSSEATQRYAELKPMTQWPIETFSEAIADEAIKSVIDSLLANPKQ